MKSIHAVSSILAVWRIGSPAAAPARPEFHAQSGHRSAANQVSGRLDSTRAPSGLSTLLSVALLQGGSPTDRRRN
jgi:hypothetical protein